jgi:non-heme chloroperoxidase
MNPINSILRAMKRRPTDTADRTPAFPAERTHDVMTDDGARLRLVECGAGPPVLLLHGFGLSANIWAPLAEQLRDTGFRVLALDQRGFGGSHPPSPQFGLDELVADVATVLSHLDLTGVTLVGHSMGGVVAQAYALRHGADRLRGLVLMNTTSNLAKSLRHRVLASAMDTPLATRLSSIGPAGLLVARSAFGHNPERSHLELMVRAGEEGNPANRRGLVGRLLGIDMTGQLRSSTTIPILVLAGSADRITPMTDTHELAEGAPDATLVIYPGAGHSVMLERTTAVAEEIAGFVARSR